MKRTLSILAATTALATPVMAENLAVVGSWSSLPLHNQYEAPFWGTTLPEASGGKITVELTTHNQMSLGLGDIYPLLGQGVYDVAMTVADYAVADAPELEGLDVPLLALTADDARAMVDAARPMVSDIYRDRFNAHVLAIAPYPPQVVFCNHEIANLGDLEGLKVRASGRMTAKLLEALGAEGVNVSFSEVRARCKTALLIVLSRVLVLATALVGGKSQRICCQFHLAVGILSSQRSTWISGTA